MHVLNVRFRSPKSPEELLAISVASLPLFRSMPGLVEKYFITNEATGEVGGVYLWETLEQLQSYVDGPVVATMPHHFDMPEAPRLEILEVRGQVDHSDRFGATAIASMRFASTLDVDRLEAISAASMNAYDDMPDLSRMLRGVSATDGRVGGLYVWATPEARDGNLAGPMFAAAPEMFGVDGEIEIERLTVQVTLSSGVVAGVQS